MQDLNFETKAQLTKYLKNITKFADSGLQGKVYRDSNLVIKIFFPSIFLEPERILGFTKLEIPDVYFPQAGIFVGKKMQGCITYYAEGTSLQSSDLSSINIDILSQALVRLRQTILKISQEQIRVSDVNFGNILFNQDHFSLIDTIDYYYSPASIDEIMYLNMQDIIPTILAKIIPPELFRCFKLEIFLKTEFSLMHPELLLHNIQSLLQEELESEASSFAEVRKRIL